MAQKIASSVWRGVEKVLYGDGKYLHFRKWKDFLSLEGKNNTTGLVFQGGILKVNQRPVHARRQKKDGSPARRYEEEALTRRVKYCRLVRKPVGRRYHYYVQLVLEGKPPRKGYTLGEGAGGLDIGTSTAAVVTDTECILTVLGDGIESIEKKQWKLQRKMDRSRRAMNPQNYNPDGTVKKGRKKWTNSSHYRRMQMEYASLCRRRAAALKQWQEVMANRIVSQCDIIYVEQMNFKALQRKAKTSAVKENGKHTRRKRFGKACRAGRRRSSAASWSGRSPPWAADTWKWTPDRSAPASMTTPLTPIQRRNSPDAMPSLMGIGSRGTCIPLSF